MSTILHKETGLLIHNYIINIPGVKKKTIYHFGDTHLTEYNDKMREDDRAYATRRTAEWERARMYYVSEYNEECNNEQLKSARTHFLNLLKLSKTGDCFIMTGDICEYINPANLELLENELKTVKTPFLGVVGNHENPAGIPNEHILAPLKRPINSLELEDILLIGIDNSKREITHEQNQELISLLSSKKPIILVMHTPIITAENAKSIKNVEDYFKLNHSGATKETERFIDIINKSGSKIAAIFAGHLHFKNNSVLPCGATQYVVGQGLLGNINCYEIGE